MNPFFQNAREGFDEIVFENRNKSYGAYALRHSYNARINLSFGLIVMTLFLFSTLQRILDKPDSGLSTVPTVGPDLIPYYEQPLVEPNQPLANSGNEKPKIPVDQGNDMKSLLVPVISNDSIDQHDLSQNNSNNNDKSGTSDLHGTEGNFAGSGNLVGSNSIPGSEDIFVDVPDTMPEFPGGESAFFRYLSHELRYPRSELTSSVVYVSFIVDAGGKVKNIDIIRSGGFSFDKEVKRVIDRMPDWKPGKMRGHSVAVRYKMPVRFTRN